MAATDNIIALNILSPATGSHTERHSGWWSRSRHNGRHDHSTVGRHLDRIAGRHLVCPWLPVHHSQCSLLTELLCICILFFYIYLFLFIYCYFLLFIFVKRTRLYCNEQ